MESDTPVLCVVSERFHFICLLIAKNASSTLRNEFGREVYGSFEQHYRKIDPSIREAYFTFAPVRDPVSRLLSAYQEVSKRSENRHSQDPKPGFLLMPDSPQRFSAFLDTLEDPTWDRHVLPQVEYLGGVRVDLFARVDRLQEGIDEMFRRLDMGPSPILPISRSRKERQEVEGFDRFNISDRDLDESFRSRIELAYQADLRLYTSLFGDGRPWMLATSASAGGEPPTTAPRRAACSPAECEGYPEPRRWVRARRDGGEIIVTSKSQRKPILLNQTGAEIWSLCDGNTSVEAICATLSARFGVEAASIRADVVATLRQLESFGVLKLRSTPHQRRGMRQIDLREIPFYVINCQSDALKRDRMEQQLTRLGLRHEFVDGLESNVRKIGTTVSHLRILNRQDIRLPFAVLEDDCVFSENFRYKFSMPSNADAYYLGVSHFGIEHPGKLSWGKGLGARWTRYDRDNLRVFNMLSAHAILYLSEGFRMAALRAQVDALCDPHNVFPGDVGLASIQASHLVLTPNVPICYQAAELNGHQGATQAALPGYGRRNN